MVDHTQGRSLWVELTGACNWSCLFCYNPWRPTDRANPEVLAFDDLVNALARLVDLLPFDYVALSGGEPLLYPQLLDVLRWVKSRGLRTILTTNGSLLDNRRAAELQLAGVDAVQISLMSLDPAVHDQLSGRSSWRQTIAGICHSVRAGIDTAIVVTSTDKNVSHLIQTARLASSLGVRRIIINELQVAGSAKLHAEELAVPRAQLVDAIAKLRESGLASSIEIVLSPSRTDLQLKDGWHRWSVSPSGDLKMCNMAETPVGNLTTMTNTQLQHLVADWDGGRLAGYSAFAEPCSCFYRRAENTAREAQASLSEQAAW
jgi:MoaA/NifB/PqqE/SkfB family radical SAM enzyme